MPAWPYLALAAVLATPALAQPIIIPLEPQHPHPPAAPPIASAPPIAPPEASPSVPPTGLAGQPGAPPDETALQPPPRADRASKPEPE